jgi:hypothetical protein
MTEQEIKDWIGIGEVTRPLRTEILEKMAHLPVPSTGPEQVETFRVLLSCDVSPGPGSIFEPAPGQVTVTVPLNEENVRAALGEGAPKDPVLDGDMITKNWHYK